MAAVAFGQSTGEIRGIVWTADGKPMAGADVVVHNAAEDSHVKVTSGSDGTFTVPNLTPGKYWIAAYAEQPQLITETSVKLELTAGETLHADVTLSKSTEHYCFVKGLLRRLDVLH